jgi:hypothetical protein
MSPVIVGGPLPPLPPACAPERAQQRGALPIWGGLPKRGWSVRWPSPLESWRPVRSMQRAPSRRSCTRTCAARIRSPKETLVSLLTWPGFDLPSASQLVGSGLAPLRISQLTLQEESGNSIILLGHRSAEAPLAYRDGLFQKVPLVEDRDPSKPDEVLVPQPLAAALGLAPGSRMSLSHNATTHATVSGVYWPGRGKDPLVYADHRLLPAAGSSTWAWGRCKSRLRPVNGPDGSAWHRPGACRRRAL